MEQNKSNNDSHKDNSEKQNNEQTQESVNPFKQSHEDIVYKKYSVPPKATMRKLKKKEIKEYEDELKLSADERLYKQIESLATPFSEREHEKIITQLRTKQLIKKNSLNLIKELRAVKESQEQDEKESVSKSYYHSNLNNNNNQNETVLVQEIPDDELLIPRELLQQSGLDDQDYGQGSKDELEACLKKIIDTLLSAHDTKYNTQQLFPNNPQTKDTIPKLFNNYLNAIKQAVDDNRKDRLEVMLTGFLHQSDDKSNLRRRFNMSSRLCYELSVYLIEQKRIHLLPLLLDSKYAKLHITYNESRSHQALYEAYREAVFDVIREGDTKSIAALYCLDKFAMDWPSICQALLKTQSNDAFKLMCKYFNGQGPHQGKLIGINLELLSIARTLKQSNQRLQQIVAKNPLIDHPLNKRIIAVRTKIYQAYQYEINHSKAQSNNNNQQQPAPNDYESAQYKQMLATLVEALKIRDQQYIDVIVAVLTGSGIQLEDELIDRAITDNAAEMVGVDLGRNIIQLNLFNLSLPYQQTGLSSHLRLEQHRQDHTHLTVLNKLIKDLILSNSNSTFAQAVTMLGLKIDIKTFKAWVTKTKHVDEKRAFLAYGSLYFELRDEANSQDAKTFKKFGVEVNKEYESKSNCRIC